jgi:anti-sigma regulatory factor (Ser/Thr protein kinase)
MEPTNTNEKPVRISILLPTNAYFMSGIRDFTMSFIKNVTKFSEQWAFRFQSIVDELCNNAIEYGSRAGQDIKLTLIYDQGVMEITVEDTGTAIVKRSAAEIRAIVDEKRKPGYVHTGIRGRGLSNIVFGWSDEVTFTDIPMGGVAVTARKKASQDVGASHTSPVSDATHLVLPS